MRVLVTSIAAVGEPWTALATHPRVELATLSASYVDCGDFGVSRPQPGGENYPVYTAPVFPTRPYPYARYLRGVAPVLREFRPDIVFAIGEPSELSVAQVTALAQRVTPRAKLALFSFENVHRDWRGFPRMLRGRAERATLPRLDLIVACTQGARQVLIERGYPAERIRVIPPAADPARFFRRPAPELHARLAPGGEFLVGYVGRLVPEKGVDVLVRALSHLPEEFALCVVGTGADEDRLRALGDAVAPGRVRWLGRMTAENVAEHLRAFDALVLPSRSIPTWQEQFGRVLVEAMMCGTPVVGSSSGAIPEVIGDAGLVFPEGDADALVECLRRLREDEALRAELVERGRARAAAEFTPTVMRDRLVQAFEELLGAAG